MPGMRPRRPDTGRERYPRAGPHGVHPPNCVTGVLVAYYASPRNPLTARDQHQGPSVWLRVGLTSGVIDGLMECLRDS